MEGEMEIVERAGRHANATSNFLFSDFFFLFLPCAVCFAFLRLLGLV
jgi:hypothetical protein